MTSKPESNRTHALPMSPPNRRQWLSSVACGFGSLAMAGLAHENLVAGSSTSGVGQLPTHHPPRAKRVIFIFMQGGPSQVDTFDYKPALTRYDGQKVEFDVARTRQITPERVFESPWKFQRYGESGQWVSELFPEQAKIVDDLCFLHGMHTEGVAHGPATLFLHTGATNLVRPSVGSWINYGLGSENQNLPGFVTVSPSAAKGGPRNYSNAFLPASVQGTPIGRVGISAREARFKFLNDPRFEHITRRQRFDLVDQLNRAQRESWSESQDTADAVVDSFELAFRMQSSAPPVIDLSSETAETLQMYGIGEQATDDFGRQCLLARRFAEEGVRYIQINYSDNGANPRWDQHSNLAKHQEHALATDKPVAALIKDLKRRGLLEDTLVWWGGEFGRTPFAQGRDGRDHNPKGFTVWLCGGGVQAGQVYGATDEFGYTAVENRVHMHDLHATLLHLLGIDHTRLTYRFAGRDFRLTDIHGRVVEDIFA